MEGKSAEQIIQEALQSLAVPTEQRTVSMIQSFWRSSKCHVWLMISKLKVSKSLSRKKVKKEPSLRK